MLSLSRDDQAPFAGSPRVASLVCLGGIASAAEPAPYERPHASAAALVGGNVDQRRLKYWGKGAALRVGYRLSIPFHAGAMAGHQWGNTDEWSSGKTTKPTVTLAVEFGYELRGVSWFVLPSVGVGSVWLTARAKTSGYRESSSDHSSTLVSPGSAAAMMRGRDRRAGATTPERRLSVIALLGIGGDRRDAHAEETARLVTEMDPAFFSALTVTVLPDTPLATLASRGKFVVPPVPELLRELRRMIALARPTSAVIRTNHASNYLALAGASPRDGERLVALSDAALAGRVRLRPAHARGL